MIFQPLLLVVMLAKAVLKNPLCRVFLFADIRSLVIRNSGHFNGVTVKKPTFSVDLLRRTERPTYSAEITAVKLRNLRHHRHAFK